MDKINGSDGWDQWMDKINGSDGWDQWMIWMDWNGGQMENIS